MTVRTSEEPAPAGYKGLTVWGPAAEVRQWLETTGGVEWVSRPRPYGSDVAVRVRMRRQLQPPRARVLPARPAAVPWWRERDKAALGALAAGVALVAVGGAVWLLVSLVVAVVGWIAENWALIVAIAVVALIGLIALFRSGGGGCAGLHCTGCRHH